MVFFPYKPLSIQTLRHLQFLSNFQSPKCSVSGKKNVRLFVVMTKTSVTSDKNVPLLTCACNDLTNFLHVVDKKTECGSYVNWAETCLEKLVKSL